MTVLENPTTPTFLSLTATEWHAFGFGLKEGLWFWKRTPLAWDEIKKMEQVPDTEKPLSLELIEALLQKEKGKVVPAKRICPDYGQMQRDQDGHDRPSGP
ncbi:MAG: hypothetical protein NTZ39_06090 [Methanoregula sp.]|nr:hypothetical protein [Methanoregula sp.]